MCHEFSSSFTSIQFSTQIKLFSLTELLNTVCTVCVYCHRSSSMHVVKSAVLVANDANKRVVCVCFYWILSECVVVLYTHSIITSFGLYLSNQFRVNIPADCIHNNNNASNRKVDTKLIHSQSGANQNKSVALAHLTWYIIVPFKINIISQ